MSVNKHKPHVLVLPEDDADRQLATGFESEVSTRQLQVLPPGRGWLAALQMFNADEAADMRRWGLNRHLVLLIDFDNDTSRLEHVKTKIPEDLRERVYIIGSLSDPQKLSSALGMPPERIGQALATDCRNDKYATWGHKLLQHNASELDRLRTQVRSILFP